MKLFAFIGKAVSCLFLVMLPFAVCAEHHGDEHADLYAAIAAFDESYSTNDPDTYFGLYAENATVYFFGARQDMAEYQQFWKEMIGAGGGVDKNEVSDLVVQIMPSGDVAVATSFIDNRTRYPDGEISEARAFETDVWQKIDGEWKIISLHYSEIPDATD
ncbi:hypothetical protein NOR51B_2276 [Luminiphilus syltensis NOR5-1B]|uniref:DUF4440 domain-containing protein n=1 Tax=Luminiphilus syltensis NOR5-1B TaxID=565045 RepID=B8KVF6_9GAMM|nr:nuclear transport factor 2 family protein [Luminiphilus syltensis]EED36326.1 hypothetical protein NOR51B_2276 [Luminiphilus syltensis NOR5-1B]